MIFVPKEQLGRIRGGSAFAELKDVKKRSAFIVKMATFLIAFGGVNFPRMSLAEAEHVQCAALFRSVPKLDTPKQAAEFIAAVRSDPLDVAYAFKISPTEFTSLENFEYIGAPKSFFIATYQGEKVLLKSKFKWGPLDVEHRPEAAWYHFLSHLRLGPKFYGTTLINGKRYLVLEFIEGTPSKFPDKASAESQLTQDKVSEMKRQLRILESFRVYAADAQFVFRKDGSVVLIDPELWRLIRRADGNEIRVEHNYLIQWMRLQWFKAGKLADDEV